MAKWAHPARRKHAPLVWLFILALAALAVWLAFGSGLFLVTWGV